VIGAPRVMVLSHAAWRAHFGGDPGVLGRALHSVQHGATYTVVGVMPPGLDLPRGVEFWTALAPTAAVNGSLEGTPWAVDVVARLAPGTRPEAARDALTAFYATLSARGQVAYGGARATVRTLPALVSGDARPAFTALAAAAAVVLLVTCGNVAGLLLVRGAERRRELAVRAAIGAGRARLVGQLVAEHAVLALAGGALGALVAAGAVRAFRALAPAELPRIADLGVDWRVLAAVVAVTALVVVLVGVAPALLASRVAPAAALGGSREGAGGRTADRRVRRALVGAQVALALVVLAAASLVGRSLAHLTALDLGIPNVERLALVELVPPAEGAFGDPSATARWRARLDAVMARVRAAPGVVAVAPVVKAPFSGTGGWDGRLDPEGAAPGDSARRPFLNMELTGAEYLRATGVPLVRGRFLTDADRADAPRVVVLSAGAARLLFPNEDAVGRRVRLGPKSSWATVVGVVGETRYREFLEPRPTVYFSYGQFPAPVTFLAVRTAGEPTTAVAAVRRAVAEVAPTVLVDASGTLRELAAAPLARPRLLSAVLGAYALVTVLLAVAGLYAVVAGASRSAGASSACARRSGRRRAPCAPSSSARGSASPSSARRWASWARSPGRGCSARCCTASRPPTRRRSPPRRWRCSACAPARRSCRRAAPRAPNRRACCAASELRAAAAAAARARRQPPCTSSKRGPQARRRTLVRPRRDATRGARAPRAAPRRRASTPPPRAARGRSPSTRRSARAGRARAS
jgi:predicted permease